MHAYGSIEKEKWLVVWRPLGPGTLEISHLVSAPVSLSERLHVKPLGSPVLITPNRKRAFYVAWLSLLLYHTHSHTHRGRETDTHTRTCSCHFIQEQRKFTPWIQSPLITIPRRHTGWLDEFVKKKSIQIGKSISVVWNSSFEGLWPWGCRSKFSWGQLQQNWLATEKGRESRNQGRLRMIERDRETSSRATDTAPRSLWSITASFLK